MNICNFSFLAFENKEACLCLDCYSYFYVIYFGQRKIQDGRFCATNGVVLHCAR